jgi:RNA polymerase sigma-70 factor, ECF subfamily
VRKRTAERSDDTEIILTCLRGGVGEFCAIVDRYQESAMAMALNILRNRQDAEDICQEAFAQAYRSLAQFDSSRSFRTWFFTILNRKCLDLLKQQKRSHIAFSRILREAPLYDSDGGVRPADRMLPEYMLGQLSPKERTTLCLWANEGFSAVEIAEVLGCSAATARVTLFNGRKKIRLIMEKSHAAR